MGVSLFSPAKINLFLAITGRRTDGYHDLVSVAAQLDFGDELEARSKEQGAKSQFTLECDMHGVPVDDTNLVRQAARAFAAATGWKQGVAFRLTKRIPVGAGLGGGSSNAVAALRALNRLAGGLLGEDELAGIAATLGSDCVLFLNPAPVVMRGRGERIEPLPEGAAQRLRGRRVLLFKPSFAISTAWAYGRMAASSSAKASAVVETRADKTEDSRQVYLPEAEAEKRLAAWLQGGAPAEEILFNNMEGAAFEKFVALPVLLGQLRSEFGLAPRLSGSGSACFALLGDPATGSGQAQVTRMKQMIAECWGPAAFVQEARIL